MDFSFRICQGKFAEIALHVAVAWTKTFPLAPLSHGLASQLIVCHEKGQAAALSGEFVDQWQSARLPRLGNRI